MTSNPDARNRWGLLIGINQYPFLGLQSYLKGCLNDVEAMSKTLMEQFGFPQENLTILRDRKATRAGIMAAMNAFAERVGEDDVVVFHYSGHGSRMRDLNGEGEDGMDETIVPHDSGRSTENRDIRDGEIYDWILRLTEKTPYVTLIFDCCHSGSIVRDAFGEQSRSVPPDLRVPEGFSMPSVSARTRSVSVAGPKKGPSGWLPLGERYVVLAGCSHFESSYEVKVGHEEGARHGALTYYLTQALAEARSGNTYLDIFERVAPRVTSMYQFQHPQLEGARDREIFGIRMIEPMRFIPVLVRNGAQVSLGAGASCGLTAGSIWGVYPSGTKTEEGETPLGEVELTAIGAVTSEARIKAEIEPDKIEVGTRAVERSRFVELRLVVEVLAPLDQPDVQRLLDLIGRSKLLRRAEEGEEPEARIYLLPPRTGAFHGEPAPSVGALREETWAVAARDGQLLMLPRPRIDQVGQDGIATIVRNLEGRTRFRHTSSLANPGSLLEGVVEMKLLRRQGGVWSEPPTDGGSEAILYDEDPICFDLTNNHDRPLHLYLMNLGSGGSVSQLYPVRGAEKPLDPGVTVRVGDRVGERLTLGFPKELSSSWHLLGAHRLEGRETFKLFVTTQPADFKVLLQPGYLR
ncbi:MAG TPA: caspase family protein, partial [Thermoanaerobaculia bacterium]|nr:caspase family protein [Thermoanaerobaculia bacterium]